MDSKYYFDGYMPLNVIKNYLSRAVTAGDLYRSETLEDDLRAIDRLGIKFLGRASGIWYMIMDDEEHFALSKKLADRVHEQDSEVILQACIFEAIFNELERVKIPEYVFRDFGEEPEDRCFNINEMLFPEAPRGFIWDGEGGVPDLNRQESRRWFYYRATRYIDCGYEALHMGQIHLYTANDRGMKKTYELFEMIRKYASIHARRHMVLMDAHTHGVNVNGKLLFDYHAMPFTRSPYLGGKGEELVLVREGFSEGGKNVNGFEAETMPYLMEYDNWGGKVVDDFSKFTREQRAYMDWWGYDQIGWFANQPEEDRNRFIEYTYRWTQINNVNAFFEAPFRRMLSHAAVNMERADNGETQLQKFYQINTKSAGCPMGFGQEDALYRAWQEGDELREKMGNPPMLLRYGAIDEYDSETGMKLPEKVVVYGSFQSQVGAVANDSNSEITRMYYAGNNTYTLSVVIPFCGEYDYAISTYGTLSATYCHDRFPRSGSANKAHFTIDKENTVVKFTYVFMDNEVKVDFWK